MTKVALDTNVLVYMHEHNELVKQPIAKRLVSKGGSISAQVVSEYINVIKRKLPLPPGKVMDAVILTVRLFDIHPVKRPTLLIAKSLLDQYGFQIFDAIIVSSALEAGCDVLYSEDMHDGLLVNGKLRIINPFL